MRIAIETETSGSPGTRATGRGSATGQGRARSISAAPAASRRPGPAAARRGSADADDAGKASRLSTSLPHGADLAQHVGDAEHRRGGQDRTKPVDKSTRPAAAQSRRLAGWAGAARRTLSACIGTGRALGVGRGDGPMRDGKPRESVWLRLWKNGGKTGRAKWRGGCWPVASPRRRAG